MEFDGDCGIKRNWPTTEASETPITQFGRIGLTLHVSLNKKLKGRRVVWSVERTLFRNEEYPRIESTLERRLEKLDDKGCYLTIEITNAGYLGSADMDAHEEAALRALNQAYEKFLESM